MKKIILFVLLFMPVLFLNAQDKNKSKAKLIKTTNRQVVQKKEVKEIHTHTFTVVPKSKIDKSKIVYPTNNKMLIRREKNVKAKPKE